VTPLVTPRGTFTPAATEAGQARRVYLPLIMK
jgi:hypothetical protein